MSTHTCLVTRLRSAWKTRGMLENLLQKFFGHENPQTTQVYYELSRPLSSV